MALPYRAGKSLQLMPSSSSEIQRISAAILELAKEFLSEQNSNIENVQVIYCAIAAWNVVLRPESERIEAIEDFLHRLLGYEKNSYSWIRGFDLIQVLVNKKLRDYTNTEKQIDAFHVRYYEDGRPPLIHIAFLV